MRGINTGTPIGDEVFVDDDDEDCFLFFVAAKPQGALGFSLFVGAAVCLQSQVYRLELYRPHGKRHLLTGGVTGASLGSSLGS